MVVLTLTIESFNLDRSTERDSSDTIESFNLDISTDSGSSDTYYRVFQSRQKY